MGRAETERHHALPSLSPTVPPLFMASDCTLGISLSFLVLGISARGNPSHLDIDRYRQTLTLLLMEGLKLGVGRQHTEVSYS